MRDVSMVGLKAFSRPCSAIELGRKASVTCVCTRLIMVCVIWVVWIADAKLPRGSGPAHPNRLPLRKPTGQAMPTDVVRRSKEERRGLQTEHTANVEVIVPQPRQL